MERVTYTFWSHDREGRIDVWVNLWSHIKALCEGLKDEPSVPIRVSIVVVRPTHKPRAR